MRCMAFSFLFISYISLKHSTYEVLEMYKTAKKKTSFFNIENKLQICKMVKSNVHKSFIAEQFSISRSTLYKILKSKKSSKDLKLKKKADFLLLIMHCIIKMIYIDLLTNEKCLSGDVYKKKLSQYVRISK